MTNERAERRYECDYTGCGKTFYRLDHLHRHQLNHGSGDATCPRCSLVFKRPDLLTRHLARHRQKDEQAGGEGLGVVNTRKRAWKNVCGNVTAQRPDNSKQRSHDLRRHHNQQEQPKRRSDTLPEQHHRPLSESAGGDAVLDRGLPPLTNLSLPWESTQPEIGVSLQPVFKGNTAAHASATNEHGAMKPGNDAALDVFDSSSNPPGGSKVTDFNHHMALDDIFMMDTANSFNMPCTTQQGFLWPFDLDISFQAAPDNVHEPQGLLTADASIASVSQPSHDAPVLNFPVDVSSKLTHRETGTCVEAALLQDRGCQPENVEDVSPPPCRSGSFGHAVDCIDSCSAHFTCEENLHAPKPLSCDFAPLLTDLCRRKILGLIRRGAAHTPEGMLVTGAHPLLGPVGLQHWSDLFFNRFNSSYPLIHRGTFLPDRTEPLLLLALLLVGSTYASSEEHELAICIHDTMRGMIFEDPGFSASPELWMLQTIILVECFGKSRAGQKQHDMAHVFHGISINLIRRSDCQTVQNWDSNARSQDVHIRWRQAMDVEQRKRLAFMCFLWDVQHAVLFSQSLCISPFELRTTLPCRQAVWEARTAEEWDNETLETKSFDDSDHSFLTVLKTCMRRTSGRAAEATKFLSPLSRLLMLHGLMAIAWEMKRRDETSLGSTGSAGAWKTYLASTYDAWKSDFDVWYMRSRNSFPGDHARVKELTQFYVGTVAIYHAAQIVLNVEILDLQLYMGADYISGRPVSSSDVARSRRSIETWASRDAAMACKAAWHAAHLLKDGIMYLDDWDAGHVFHYSWTLFLSVVTCCTYHAIFRSLEHRGKEHQSGMKQLDAETDMLTLISIMSCAGLDGVRRSAGRLSTRGLLAITARQLSKVKWALAQEAANVLNHRLDATENALT